MTLMNTREKTVALRRKHPKITAAEIARQIGVSRERIRQILKSEDLPTGGFDEKGERLKKMRNRIEYKCWWNMLDRCSNPKNPVFRHYGGRGISVAVRWREFENFFADMGPRPGPGYSIERIDNDGNYTPSNCKWATKKEQVQNSRPRSAALRQITEPKARVIWRDLSIPTNAEAAKLIGLSERQCYRKWKASGRKPGWPQRS